MATATAEQVQQLHDLIVSKLEAKFPGVVLHSEIQYDFPVIEVNKANIYQVLEFLKSDPELSFEFLTTMCGLHYPDNSAKEFGMMYQLHNLPKNTRIRIKTFFPASAMELPTMIPLWAGANWMEREAFDFFGITFKGHPNLKRILNMEDITFFPLRKDFPLEDPTRDDKNDSMFGR